MKKHARITALLLCFVLLISLIGCTNEPAPTEPAPTEPVPTVPPVPTASERYAQAREALDSAQSITLDVTVTTYTIVNGEEFSEQSVQTLSYNGIGTDAFTADMESAIQYGIHLDGYEPEETEDTEILYREIYIDGKLYIETENMYQFSAAMDAEAAQKRYIPVVLLDAALYGEVTAEEAEENTMLLFAAPTAAESWALPEEAELTDANGVVTLDANGVITQMEYTVSYTYGPSEVKLEVVSKPQAESKEIAAPDKTDSYTVLSDVDAVALSQRATGLMVQATTASVTNLDNITSQVAAYVEMDTVQVDLHGRKEDTQTKIETNVTVINGLSGNETYKQVEKYVDGRYTVTENGGLPSTVPGIDWETMREYVSSYLLANSFAMDYWFDVTVTDLGSVYLLEITPDELFGNTAQNLLCETLWEDPSFLMNLASNYETKTVSGYLSIDKYTGLPTACGYVYEGVHTIDGQDYSLSMQHDQSIEAPSQGAYQEITGRLPEEAEPKNKATPLFYHVTGDEGQEMWLLGTVHVGDERTAYLPKEIREAFESADALALECDAEAFEQQVEEDEALQAQVAQAYYYTDGTTLESLLEAEEYARAVQFMKATGNYSMNMLASKPYLWSDAIDQFYLRQGRTLHSDQGVEARLTDWAEELDKPIWEVESSMFQLQMLTGFSQDIQLMLLKGSMETPFREEWEAIVDLYEKWCDGDEAALREMISEAVDTAGLTEAELAEYEAYKPLIEEYEKTIGYDRNIGMLEVAKKYLESGNKVFYAVGLAHLLDAGNGLVDALREAGYTVELVVYQ